MNIWIKCAKDNAKAVGVVRLLWDGGYIAFYQILSWILNIRDRGIGIKLVETCFDRIKADVKPGYKVNMCLLAAKGEEPFHEEFGFDERSNERLGAGMDQWLVFEK